MNELQTTATNEIITSDAMAHAGQVANNAAEQNVFLDYTSRKAANTVKAQRFDLAVFSDYLTAAGIPDAPDADRLQTSPNAWYGVSWGLIEGFVKWQLQEAYSTGSINRRLSTCKAYVKLAAKAGVISAQEMALIRTVSGYGQKEAKRINETREQTRRGNKKAAPVSISDEKAESLKSNPDTPQGRRDAVIMTLLLDHGLRVGEVAQLTVTDFDLKKGKMLFYRPKVDLEQTHKLSTDTLRALQAWFDSGDALAMGPLLRGSRKGGKLTGSGMTETSITERVRTLGQKIDIEGLSAHDCRHYWATKWAGKVDVLRLQEAGGWNSLAMPRRYVERAQIANEGMA